MRGRKWVALQGVVILVTVVAFVLCLREDRITEENRMAAENRITAENFVRIQHGTTRAEVEAVLGPPGNYSSQPAVRPPRLLLGMKDSAVYVW
jgi:hypothetical protein